MVDLGWFALFPCCLGQLEPTAEAGSGELEDGQHQGLGLGQSSNSFVILLRERPNCCRLHQVVCEETWATTFPR